MPNITNAAYAERAKWLKMEIGKRSTGLGEICTIIRLAVEEDLDKVDWNYILFIVQGAVGIQNQRAFNEQHEKETFQPGELEGL